MSRQINGLIAENRQTLKPALDKLNQLLTIVDHRKERIAQAIKGFNQYAMSSGESMSAGPFFKFYIANLLPGQFIQPFVDAAFSDLGLDPNVLPPSQRTDPQTGQPGTPPLPMPFPRTGQGGEPHLTLPDAITGNPGDTRYPYREPLPAPPPGGPPPGPPPRRSGRADDQGTNLRTGVAAALTLMIVAAAWCCCTRQARRTDERLSPTSTTATASSSATRSASSEFRSARSTRSNRRPERVKITFWYDGKHRGACRRQRGDPLPGHRDRARHPAHPGLHRRAGDGLRRRHSRGAHRGPRRVGRPAGATRTAHRAADADRTGRGEHRWDRWCTPPRRPCAVRAPTSATPSSSCRRRFRCSATTARTCSAR